MSDTKLVVNSSVVSFDHKLITTNDKLSVKVVAFRGVKFSDMETAIVEKLTAAKIENPADLAKSSVLMIKNRLENVTDGIALVLQNLQGVAFPDFIKSVKSEIKNNSSLYALLQVGDATILMGRTVKGKVEWVSSLDVKVMLDALSGISSATATKSPDAIESVEIVF